jgi:hypothetical protein
VKASGFILTKASGFFNQQRRAALEIASGFCRGEWFQPRRAASTKVSGFNKGGRLWQTLGFDSGDRL